MFSDVGTNSERSCSLHNDAQLADGKAGSHALVAVAQSLCFYLSSTNFYATFMSRNEEKIDNPYSLVGCHWAPNYGK